MLEECVGLVVQAVFRPASFFQEVCSGLLVFVWFGFVSLQNRAAARGHDQWPNRAVFSELVLCYRSSNTTLEAGARQALMTLGTPEFLLSLHKCSGISPLFQNTSLRKSFLFLCT